MSVPAPHFLLYAEAALSSDGDDCTAERWRFVLRTVTGETAAEATDEEPTAGRERLELLAVIRGLEALDQPSRITLMSGSRSLQCGLESGLSQWRENNWHWERYGRLTPIKNADLWQRLDRLSSIHSIQCPQGRRRANDDLAPPLTHTTKSGRKLRFDPPSTRQVKQEKRNSKHEKTSRFKARNKQQQSPFRHWCFLLSNSFRISSFVISVLGQCLLAMFLRRRASTEQTTHRPSTLKSRGVPRAHDGLARRHERPARRPTGPPA